MIDNYEQAQEEFNNRRETNTMNTIENTSQIMDILKVHLLTEKFLPLYTTKVPAGAPHPGDDHKDTWIDLNKHLLENPESSFCVRVEGNSMIDAGIYPGDLLIVDCSIQATNGRVVVAVVAKDVSDNIVKDIHMPEIDGAIAVSRGRMRNPTPITKNGIVT